MQATSPQPVDTTVSLLAWLVVLLAICAIAVLFWWILKRALQAAATHKAAAADGGLPATVQAATPMRRVGVVVSFARAKRFLRAHVAGRDYRYEVPWILMLGARNSGTSTVLANAGVSTPLDEEGGPTFGQANGIEWWFYRQGLVLNPPGDMVLRADGRASDALGFDLLLNRLIRKGPRRPLDGLVLAISAEDLLNRSRRAELIGKAAVIRHKLSLIRKRLSMRLPVYVLVTKCDLVRGFSAFAAELEPIHDDMFGWSNSYPFDAAFLPDWVDQGFEEMRSLIAEQQMDIFVERNNLPDSDGVFLFPSEFQALCQPLRAYLTQVFQDTAYEESFFFRGFYFTGDARRELPQPAPEWNGDDSGNLPALVESGVLTQKEIPAEQVNRNPVFLRDLLRLKIFPESGLAKPLSRINMSRNRTVIVAGVLTTLFILVVGLGTLLACLRLYDLKNNHLDSLFSNLLADLKAAPEPTTGTSTESVTQRAARMKPISNAAVNVVSSMGLLSGRRFGSVFIPASWNGSIDRQIEDGLAVAFQRIVLEAFRLELSHRLTGPDGILKSITPTQESAEADVEYPSPESVPEYQAWTKFVADLKVLEDNIDRYNRICVPGSGDLSDFRGLAQYVHLDANLPPNFNFDNPYFERILSQASSSHLDYPHRDATVAHAKSLITGFFEHWYGKHNRIAIDVDRMVEQIDAFVQRPSGTVYQQLKDLSDGVVITTEDLDSPAFEWLSRDQFQKEQFPIFNQAGQSLQYLENFDVDSWTQQEGARTFTKLKEGLRSKSTRLTGLVLDFDVEPVEVSSSVATLQANIAFLLSQPFVVRDPGEPMQFTQTRLLWDKTSLLEAQKLFDAYDRFARGSLRSMPHFMQDVMRGVALERLQGNVLDLVGEAERPVTQTPANEIDAELQSFSGSVDVLQQLVAGFGKFTDSSLATRFNTLLISQASTMLTVLNQELQEQNPYGVKNGGFDWWEGGEPLSLAAYEVTSADALKDYLDRQLTDVQSLANQAEPLVRLLQSRSVLPQTAPILAAWRAILDELKKHSEKKPGNSVDMLADFIETGLDKIAPDTFCQGATREPVGRTDLFLNLRGTIRTEVTARCRILSQRAYVNQIAELFNNTLAGRFPFSSAPSGSSAPQQNAVPEADPTALANFLKHLDQYGKVAQDSLKQNPQFGKSGAGAMEFLSQMAQIRPTFLPFTTGFEKDPVPSFDFNVAFRVNPVKAIDANEVADWGLDVGQQSFRYRGKDNSGNWRLGDPIRVTLRFADDSPLVPVADPSQPDMVVNKRVVTFEYTDEWSLFRLLLTHKANRGEIDMQSQKPHLLSFYIPTAPDKTLPQPKEGSVGGLVRVYVQLTVLPPGAKDGVNIPLPFPDAAPMLTTTGTAQN